MSITRARHSALQAKLIELKNDLKKINNYLKGIRREIDINEIEISGYDLFNLWLNRTIFHLDVEADEIFSSLGILTDLTEVNFAKYIDLYSNFIVHLSNAIESGLATNGFDILNKLSPHFNANFILEIKDETDKSAVIRFWEGTKQIPQTRAICETHDQDPVIAVTNFDESDKDLKVTKVELKSCCKDASENALSRIHNSLAWIDYLQKHKTPKQEKPTTYTVLSTGCHQEFGISELIFR